MRRPQVLEAFVGDDGEGVRAGSGRGAALARERRRVVLGQPPVSDQEPDRLGQIELALRRRGPGRFARVLVGRWCVRAAGHLLVWAPKRTAPVALPPV